MINPQDSFYISNRII